MACYLSSLANIGRHYQAPFLESQSGWNALFQCIISFKYCLILMCMSPHKSSVSYTHFPWIVVVRKEIRAIREGKHCLKLETIAFVTNGSASNAMKITHILPRELLMQSDLEPPLYSHYKIILIENLFELSRVDDIRSLHTSKRQGSSNASCIY